ncbi:MAG: hypothetical protein HZB41_13715 [Ignavibacteriae bacterium]|nr:hypothetical protein [Ignavibacteriota bacterium]
MKKALMIMIILSLITVFGYPKESYAKTKKVLNENVCKSVCKDFNKLNIHDEKKGHACGSECKAGIKNNQTNIILKEHTCTSECKDGNHDYLHGEKGHVCGAECKAGIGKNQVKTILNEHLCNEGCKEGKHVFKHGEKGHVCGAECMK